LLEQLAMYNFRRLLENLKSKRGRGTELISLYIPPGRNIYDVIKYLRQEYDQAGNIKDKLTRKNVQSAIESIIQRLKLYRKVPDNGLVVFCGAIPRGSERGTEKIEIYVVEPPEPVQSFRYICDHEFYLDPLLDMTKEKKAYGLIVMDRGGATIAVLRGSSYEIVSELNSDIPPKHSAGGQSQRRFERIREERVQHFYNKVGEEANKIFVPMLNELEGLIIGGPGDAREEFASGDYLDYRLRQKILGNIPTSYTESQGIRELISKSEELMKEASIFREKQEVDKFLTLLSKKPNIVTYGMESVIEQLKSGSVEVVLLLDDINVFLAKRKCLNCGYEEVKYVDREGLEKMYSESWVCPNCRATSFDIEERDIVDHIEELARETKASVHIISAGTEWGEQLRAFGGIAAILRYEVV